MTGNEKILVIFDFDWSLIDENSDMFVFDELASPELKAEINSTIAQNTLQWTDFMDFYLGKLHDQEGITKDRLIETMAKIPFRKEMIEAIRLAKHQAGSELIILSDANSVFIDIILKSYGCDDIFSHIVTNPARFDKEGRLRVERWIPKESKGHGCLLCSENMCKGQDLEEYLKGKSFSSKVYIGDSRNDFCPSKKLSKNDHVLAREGRALLKLLKGGKEEETAAKVHGWENAGDVLRIFRDEIFASFTPSSSSSL